jgi:cytosine/adenosine deaminase-related metal-dependent hydrolase
MSDLKLNNLSRRNLMKAAAIGLGSIGITGGAKFNGHAAPKGKGSVLVTEDRIKSKILISGGVVLTLVDDARSLEPTDVLVERGRIAAIGSNLNTKGASQIDANGCVVMPGLVNAHLHCWQTPLRGIGVNWTLNDYMAKIFGEFGPRFSPEDVYWSTLGAALDQIDAGTTTVLDWCHNAPTLAHAGASLAALRDAGIRALYLRPGFTPGGWSDIDIPSDAKGLITLGMNIIGPAWAPLDTVRSEFRRAQERDEVISMHWAGPLESDAFRKLAQERLLTPKVNIVHGNGMADEELKALISSGATITVSPEVEMQMGFSPSISGKILANGARPSIGVDSEVGSSPEMLQAARFAMQLQRYVDHQTSWQRSGKPMESASPSAFDVLQWASVGGARTIGLSEHIGTLEPGKLADILVVRIPEVTFSAGLDPAQLIVSRASADDIDTVMVGGRIRKKSGKRLGTSDVELRCKLAEISRRVLKA